MFESEEAYLASLNLIVTLRRNDVADAPRVGELSRKTNQFNLTTVRYTQGEIEGLMRDADVAVYAVEVADRFGASGLTGAAVVRYAGPVATVESLFISCRVLGRGIEFALWPRLLADAAARGCATLNAVYRPTAKNVQTSDFYDRLGLTPSGGEGGETLYSAALETFAPQPPAWIEVRHG